MKPELIDEFDSLDREEKKNQRNIKIVSGILGVLFFVFGFFSYPGIFRIFNFYFEIRHKIPLYYGLNTLVIAISLSIIPLIAYNRWAKSTNGKPFINYLTLLFATIFFYAFFVVIGIELIFISPKLYDENPFSPSYAFTPPFPYCFDLLFVFSTGMVFLVMRLVFRKRKK